MAGFFDPRNDFWRTVSAVGDVLGLSVLWMFACLPLITIGPATAALYYAVTKYVRPMKVGAFAGFFRSFKENFKVGALATLAVSPVLYVVFWVELAGYATNSPTALGVAGHMVAILLTGMVAYVFPVLARFDHGLFSLLKTSVSLAVAHLPTTAVAAILVLFTAIFCMREYWPLVFLPAVTTILLSLLFERVFRKHLSEEERERFRVVDDD